MPGDKRNTGNKKPEWLSRYKKHKKECSIQWEVSSSGKNSVLGGSKECLWFVVCSLWLTRGVASNPKLQTPNPKLQTPNKSATHTTGYAPLLAAISDKQFGGFICNTYI